jgi:SAM-dependent methyltransferase
MERLSSETERKEQSVLDLGCGPNKEPGSIGCDRVPLPGVDILHDLDVFPYPLKDGSFDRIVVRHCLEHLQDVVRVMEELHRIARPGGEVVISMPHYSSANAFGDPTHKHYFALHSFDLFAREAPYGYVTKGRFALTHRRVEFWPWHDRWPWLHGGKLGLRWLIEKHPIFYERFLAFTFPIKEFTVHLRVIKGPARFS